MNELEVQAILDRLDSEINRIRRRMKKAIGLNPLIITRLLEKCDALEEQRFQLIEKILYEMERCEKCSKE